MSMADLITVVNSNPMEPLNFNQYLTDICTFGANSYVFAKGNEKLFHALLNKSAMMYGHKAIHNVIYNRLTAEDVDFVINNNARLGKHLNMFYVTTDLHLAKGNIDDITSALTFKQFNTLEKKFQEGFGRYFNTQLISKDIGAWLCRISNDDCFKHITNIEEIFTDNLCHDKVRNAENLKLILVNSTALYTKQLADEILCELLPAMLESITSTEKATGLTIQNTKLDYIFNNSASMLAISKNEAALTCLMQSANGFKGFVNSKYFADVFTSSQVIDITVKVLEVYQQHATNLKTIQDNLEEALKCGKDINNGTLWAKEIQGLQEEVITTINSLRTSIEPLANTIANGKGLLTNSQMRNIFENKTQVADELFSYDSFCEAFFAEGGAALYYANHNPLTIYRLLEKSDHFKNYLRNHAESHKESNTFSTNSKNPFIITDFSWKYQGSSTTGTAKTTGINFYRMYDKGLMIITGTDTISDSGVLGLSGWRGEVMILFSKDGVYNIAATYTTDREIKYFVIK